jgi:hypothetical protein
MDEKQSEPIGAVAMKHRIQEKIYEDTKDMTPEAFIAYMRQRIMNSQFADFLKQVDSSQSQFAQTASSIDDPTFVRGDQGIAEERLPLE